MPTQSQDPVARAGMTRAMTFLFAFGGAAAVGNLYWAQPLLTDIAASLGISIANSGAFITVTQLGYAVGVLLLVPLGDVLNRRRLVPTIMTCSAIVLLVCAFAPTYLALLGALALLGLTSLSGQLLVPLAGDLARDDQRGQVIGTIASGLLIGIMLSRLISGVISEALGWRAVYVAAAIFNIVLVVLLARGIPDDRARASVRYGKLLLSIVTAVKQSSAVQVTLSLGACTFAVFTMFWTGLTYLLSSDVYGYSTAQIGLVNLAGLAGAVAAQRVGRLHDRGLSTQTSGAALLLILVSLAVAAFYSTAISVVLIAIMLLNLAIQSVNVLNQTRLMTIKPELRSRLNTAFVVCNFLAGALGSSVAGIIWESGGWQLLSVTEGAIGVVALGVWILNRKTLRHVEAHL